MLLNRHKNGQSILCGTHLGPHSSWDIYMNEKLQRLNILQESNNHGSANAKIKARSSTKLDQEFEINSI